MSFWKPKQAAAPKEAAQVKQPEKEVSTTTAVVAEKLAEKAVAAAPRKSALKKEEKKSVFAGFIAALKAMSKKVAHDYGSDPETDSWIDEIADADYREEFEDQEHYDADGEPSKHLMAAALKLAGEKMATWKEDAKTAKAELATVQKAAAAESKRAKDEIAKLKAKVAKLEEAKKTVTFAEEPRKVEDVKKEVAAVVPPVIVVSPAADEASEEEKSDKQ